METCAFLMQVNTLRFSVFVLAHETCQSLARISNPALQGLMPARNTLRYSFPQTAIEVCDALSGALATIESIIVSSQDSSSPSTNNALIVRMAHDTWSRAARRKKRSRGPAMLPESMNGERLVVSVISVLVADKPMTTVLQFDWVKGHSNQRATWESFVSHVERKVKAALATRRAVVEDIDVAMS